MTAAGRAAEIGWLSEFARLLPMSGMEAAKFTPMRESLLKNWNGAEVGRVARLSSEALGPVLRP